MRWWAWPILAAGVVVPVLSYMSVKVVQWFIAAAIGAVKDAVEEIAAKPIKEMSDALGHSLDELRESNAREHADTASQFMAMRQETGDRLDALEERVTDVDRRLEAVEGGVYHVAEAVHEQGESS